MHAAARPIRRQGPQAVRRPAETGVLHVPPAAACLAAVAPRLCLPLARSCAHAPVPCARCTPAAFLLSRCAAAYSTMWLLTILAVVVLKRVFSYALLLDVETLIAGCMGEFVHAHFC